MLLDRLIHLALPRIRDFQGISQKVLMVGNYSLGLEEQLMFRRSIMIKLIKFEEWMFLLLRLQKNEDGLTILKQFGLLRLNL
jgi:large subunit ribosomal protein L5